MLRRSFSTSFLFVILLAGSFGFAEDKPVDSARSKSIDVQQLIRDLDSDKFAVRRDASQMLQDMGKGAFPALVEATKLGSREVTSRALAILKHHFKNGDDDTKAAAEAALQQLAKSDDTSIARRAKEAIKPEDKPQDPFSRPQIFPNRIRIRVQAIQGNRRQVKVAIGNGVKEVEVEENDRKIKIVEDPNGIKLDVTEKKDGKEVTKKYEAKNADDLKKKHPEAHKIYQQYQQNNGGIQIQARAGGVKVLPGNNQAVPQLQPNRVAGIDNLDKIIEKYRQKAAQGGNSADHYRRVVERLEKHKARLEEIQKQLHKKGEARTKLEEDRKRIQEELDRQRAKD